MLRSNQLLDIQVRTERLYMQGRHEEMLNELGAQATRHPSEELLAYSYAHHALMLDLGKTHKASARRLLEQRLEPRGHSPDDVWIARLLADEGDIERALGVLSETPFYGNKGYVSYAALATWLAGEHGRPELAPMIPDPNLPEQIAQLRIAAMVNDVEHGRILMNQILTGIENVNLSAPLTVGNVPCPAFDIALGEWLDDAFDAWGGKISWLAAEQRQGLIELSHRLQRSISCHPGQIEKELMMHLEQGNIVKACRAYQTMATDALSKRCSVPMGWRKADVGHPQDLEAAVQAGESLLVNGQLDARVILPWYHNVWAELIDQLPARRRPGYHMAVLTRTNCAAARMACARAYAASGQYVRAMRMIQPMRYYAAWADEALAHEREWHSSLVSSQVRVIDAGQ